MWKPMGGRLIIKMATPKATSEGGIILPDSSIEVKAEGEVLSVGAGVTTIKVGDKVLYSKCAGDAIMDKQHRILREVEVLAIINGGEKWNLTKRS